MIYLAGPLFTAAERQFNAQLAAALQQRLGEEVFLPQERCSSCVSSREIFACCRDGIDRSRLLMAVLDGPDADSGTCFEAGYAHAKGIPVIGIRTDFRQSCDDGGLNLMLSQSCMELVAVSSLDSADCVRDIVDTIEKIRRPFKADR